MATITTSPRRRIWFRSTKSCNASVSLSRWSARKSILSMSTHTTISADMWRSSGQPGIQSLQDCGGVARQMQYLDPAGVARADGDVGFAQGECLGQVRDQRFVGRAVHRRRHQPELEQRPAIRVLHNAVYAILGGARREAHRQPHPAFNRRIGLHAASFANWVSSALAPFSRSSGVGQSRATTIFWSGRTFMLPLCWLMNWISLTGLAN